MAAELELAQQVVALATAAGATQAEATYAVADRFSTEARGSEIVKLEQSVGRSLTLRVFARGGKASLGTSDLSRAGLERFVRETVDAARYVAADEHAGLPEPGGETSARDADDLRIYSNDVRERDAVAKIDDALALERLVRAADARVINSSGSRVADHTTSLALANSFGFAGAYRSSQASIGSGPIARDGDTKRPGSYGSASRSYAGLEALASVASKATGRAVAFVGARKPPTMRVPVIFERDVAASVLADFFAAISAANVAIGNSFLADRIGERVASDIVTIVDDGRIAGGLGTSPFDGEGVATRRTSVVEHGVLRTFLYDSYFARRLGATSTANAAGGGIGPNNFTIVPGAGDLDALVARTSRGVLVLDTIGFSTESVTGTYSRGARGLLIENGEIAGPIDEFTIAGNLLDMFGAIDAIADDVVYDQAIVSPSFRVGEMTVSGS
ncbi:MAG: metalloprotease PmbA [Vulcanimicrobiaceae bacterium]